MDRVVLIKLFAYYMFGRVLGMVLILVLKMWLDCTHGFCIMLTCQFGFTNMSRDPSKNLGGIQKTTLHWYTSLFNYFESVYVQLFYKKCNGSRSCVMFLEFAFCSSLIMFCLSIEFSIAIIQKKLQCFSFTCSFISFTSNAPLVVLRVR